MDEEPAKLLTVVVPAYNSQDYLLGCLESIPMLPEIEVIVVDDGSSDSTEQIARDFASGHETVVRVISKPNGGHGSAINLGLAEARGRYLKILDSDDHFDTQVAVELVDVIRIHSGVDLIITNFVYDKAGKLNKHAVHFRRALPVGRVCAWDETKRFGAGDVLLMHSLCYRTELLRDMDFRLPEHTFYVDNLFAFIPLARTKTLFYLDRDLYRYFIGRPDQSVNEDVQLKRIQQQLKINRMMIDHLPEADGLPVPLWNYLVHYLGMVTAVSSVLLLRSGTAEHLRIKQQLWAEIEAKNPVAYSHLRYGLIGIALNLQGVLGRKASLQCYRMARSIVGFN